MSAASPARTTSTAAPAITATGLTKSYGDKTVLNGIDLNIAEGTIFALLGPNGAGKTTAVKILSTLITADPDSGPIHVGGHDLAADPQALRAAIGVTGQFSAVDGLITGQENMLLMADLHQLSRSEGRRTAAELLERFDLTEAAKKPVSTYSGGMKRRLDLAMTLVGNPRIIFLDEPTTGLDPRSRNNMWQIIRELVSGGVTVFLTTQYLEEADELADRIAVLFDGKIAAEGSADELKRIVPGGHVRLRFSDPAAYQSAAVALILLPLISSAFIPADTMPGWFQPIAEYQPFTPAIETLRGLLLGTEIGNNWWITIVWCVGLTALGYRWSTSLFNRDPK